MTRANDIANIFKRTAAEIAASVTPTDYSYQPGDVRRYGAVGDGTTDDTDAVAAAITATQHVILQKDATYLLSSWAMVDTTAAVRITGNGATLKGPSAGTVFLSSSGRQSIEGVTFDRWSSVLQRLTAQTGSIAELLFKNNRCINCTGIPIYIERPVDRVLIDGNEFLTCSGGYAIRIGTNTYASQDDWLRIIITRNKFKSLSATGTTSVAAALVYGREVEISSNHVDGVAQSGTGEAWGFYTKCRYSHVFGNRINNITAAGSGDIVGLNIKGTTRAVTSSPQGFGTLVYGNQVRSVGSLGVSGYGIRIQTDDVNCYGNEVEDTGLSGIGTDEASAYSGVKIDNNKVRFTTLDAATAGIRVEGGATGITVHGNTCINAGIGVRVQANVAAIPMNNVSVIGNKLLSCTYPVMYDAQASATLNRLTVSNNTADSGTSGILWSGSAGTVTNLTVTDNDFAACTSFASGAIPVGSTIRAITTLATADATPASVLSLALADESAFLIETKIVGRKSDSTDRGAYHLEGLIYRDGAGVATIQTGVASVITAIESNAAWNGQVLVSGNALTVTCTGAAATTINWKAITEITSA